MVKSDHRMTHPLKGAGAAANIGAEYTKKFYVYSNMKL